MELFADVFNAMKAELKGYFPGATFSLVRATETHTAWRGESQSFPFIVVRDNKTGNVVVDAKYDWFRK